MLHAWGHPWREASFIPGSTRALLATLSLWTGGGGKGQSLGTLAAEETDMSRDTSHGVNCVPSNSHVEILSPEISLCLCLERVFKE